MASDFTRREFVQLTAGFGAVMTMSPLSLLSASNTIERASVVRTLGKTNWQVKTLSLGGQASLQWTRSGIDPVEIILEAINRGINYIDTSNVYGPSQTNFGKAFKKMMLVPGNPGYNEKLRRSLFIATKTKMRYAYSEKGDKGPGSGSNGQWVGNAMDDVKRSLVQMFGDGERKYPEGSYLDSVQIHNLTSFEEVDAIYNGLDNPDSKHGPIGALAGLLDLRDGTNRTGLNPKKEKLIRHIGITGHLSSPVLIYAIQRDEMNIIDTLLVAININDRGYLNHQYNAIPVAKAKNMGVIGMKVFADGVFYGKRSRFSFMPRDVILSVGSSDMPSNLPIQYSLSVPGVDTVIIGTGNTQQLEANIIAANSEYLLDEKERRYLEEGAKDTIGTDTNYFQKKFEGLSKPRNVKSIPIPSNNSSRAYNISWDAAYAGNEPIVKYEVLMDDKIIGFIDYSPQTTLAPFTYKLEIDGYNAHEVSVKVVDRGNDENVSKKILL